MGVYTIVLAVRPAPRAQGPLPGHEFLMVRNRKRAGWELPGGRAEPGETAVACAEREFLEETGRVWIAPRLIQRRSGPLGEGHVFLCGATPVVRPPLEAEIMEATFFGALPPRGLLSFPDDPYPELFEAARKAMQGPPGPTRRNP